MASVTVDPKNVHEFADEQNFFDWLARNHDKEDEVWIKIRKVSSGLARTWEGLARSGPSGA